ncbi:hypothetical protein EDEG_03079 [Edhazardia aedis USNM 41457]|uniref:Uncharacterized protein n=1 Tax=Edhazardia aedis (strain USNM 41457) TaxID=1003232 RepID=J8ZS40_EDHAE|nr:hypothetical protein EDEG_03079 [Edhazardia aedis USNM 41457]|eukprot:EJW02513.1 hypothetical protein EDEG_03079 [Edhazardia aedis USNM 41457]
MKRIYKVCSIFFCTTIIIFMIHHFGSKEFKDFKKQMSMRWRQNIDKILQEEDNSPWVKLYKQTETKSDHVLVTFSWIQPKKIFIFSIFKSNNQAIDSLLKAYIDFYERKTIGFDNFQEAEKKLQHCVSLFKNIEYDKKFKDFYKKIDCYTDANASILVKLFTNLGPANDFLQKIGMLKRFKNKIERIGKTSTEYRLNNVCCFFTRDELEIIETNTSYQKIKYLRSFFSFKNKSYPFKVNELVILMLNMLQAIH